MNVILFAICSACVSHYIHKASAGLNRSNNFPYFYPSFWVCFVLYLTLIFLLKIQTLHIFIIQLIYLKDPLDTGLVSFTHRGSNWDQIELDNRCITQLLHSLESSHLQPLTNIPLIGPTVDVGFHATWPSTLHKQWSCSKNSANNAVYFSLSLQTHKQFYLIVIRQYLFLLLHFPVLFVYLTVHLKSPMPPIFASLFFYYRHYPCIFPLFPTHKSTVNFAKLAVESFFPQVYN